MSSWSTRVWDDWLKNGTPYHDGNDALNGVTQK